MPCFENHNVPGHFFFNLGDLIGELIVRKIRGSLHVAAANGHTYLTTAAQNSQPHELFMRHKRGRKGE